MHQLRRLSHVHKLILTSTLSIATSLSLLFPAPLGSANLTSVKNTLTSTSYLASRLSWGARVEADGTDEGASRVQIQSAPAAPLNSTTTSNLKAGDSILINTNAYTVVDIIDSDEFTVSPVIQAGDADDGDPIYLEIKPRHVITFSTASAVADGFFQVLIPADTTGSNDGNLDDGGFDFGGGSIDVTASDTGNYDFSPTYTVATASGGTLCTAPSGYHCFETHYSGTGGIGTSITINIGGLTGTNSLISPGEGTSHTEGTADTYSFIVKNFAAGADPETSTAVDQTTGKIALIEAVRVTATIEPTINFTIAGVNSGATHCGTGATTDVNTTALSVPFGSLSTLDSFYDAAQDLTVSTNASGGYVVTAAENDELSIGGAGTIIIPDTPCDTGPCTSASEQAWVTATNNGFGYSLQNDGAASIEFEWDDTTPTTGFDARQFATLGTDSPATLFSSTTVASSEGAYVCYRISIDATQQAGDYENQVNYTATGTF